jgi:hypothetical protein
MSPLSRPSSSDTTCVGVWRCCQTKANWSPKSTITLRSSDKLTPFGQGGGAVFLEGFAAVQMALIAEVIVD